MCQAKKAYETRNPNHPPDLGKSLVESTKARSGVHEPTTAWYLAELTERPLLLYHLPPPSEGAVKQNLYQAARWSSVLLLENVELIFSQEEALRNSSSIISLEALQTYRGLAYLTKDRIEVSDSTLVKDHAVDLGIEEEEREFSVVERLLARARR